MIPNIYICMSLLLSAVESLDVNDRIVSAFCYYSVMEVTVYGMVNAEKTH